MVIELKVDRFEEEKVFLRSEDNDLIIWPKNKLPREIREGSLLAFSIKSDLTTDINESGKTAKDILNELLDVEEEK